MGTRADVSERVYLLPCHCQVPLCGESWGRRGRWWVTRRPGARDSGGPAWAPRGGLAARSTRGGRGQSRAPGQLLSCSRLPCRGAARRGPWGWDGPGRTGRVGTLLSGWGFFYLLSCPVVVGRRERDEASPSQQREDAASLSFRCAALQLPEGFSRFDHDDETPWLPVACVSFFQLIR